MQGDMIQVETTSTGDDELDTMALCLKALADLCAKGKASAAAAVSRYLYDRFDHGTHDGTGRGFDA